MSALSPALQQRAHATSTEMDSETSFTTRPVSSNLPRQGWPRLSPSHAPAAGPSNHTHRHKSPTDSAAAYRATTLRQLNTHTAARPPSRPPKADIPPERPSTTPSRPVLVRAYSGDADKPSRPSTMSRFFPFSGSRSSASRPSQPQIALPSDKDFSIECILQAIEPDIRSTLDSIAEICGRSKLSLANEYGSHIAPLGEICASSNSLGPVEEASPSEELRGEGTVITQANATDAGDMQPFSFHRYLENLRHTASIMESASQNLRRSGSPPSPGMDSEAETVFPISEIIPTVCTREFASAPTHTGSDLLAKKAARSGGLVSSQMTTSAVVSEVYIDASADDGVSPDDGIFHLPLSRHDPSFLGNTRPEIIQSLLGWLKWAATFAGSAPSPSFQSAEDRLRAMLHRPENEGSNSAAR